MTEKDERYEEHTVKEETTTTDEPSATPVEGETVAPEPVEKDDNSDSDTDTDDDTSQQ